MAIRLQSVTAEAFAPFGSVLEFPPDCSDAFHIVVKEPEQPWRLAVFRYTNREISVMENHPASMESFEPLSGVTVLLVAEHNSPDACSAFLLDKPVCLKKGIWHQVLSLTPEAQVKIAENMDVNSEFHTLAKPVFAALTEE